MLCTNWVSCQTDTMHNVCMVSCLNENVSVQPACTTTCTRRKRAATCESCLDIVALAPPCSAPRELTSVTRLTPQVHKDEALRSCLHMFEALRNATETRVMERVRTHARRGDPTPARKHVYTHVYKCVYKGVYKRAPKKATGRMSSKRSCPT